MESGEEEIYYFSVFEYSNDNSDDGSGIVKKIINLMKIIMEKVWRLNVGAREVKNLIRAEIKKIIIIRKLRKEYQKIYHEDNISFPYNINKIIKI